ncbi:LysR family transcriptional regulator [Shinella pollutisoli]|uniref:LysR substrate-binding domain-containing protein n=1 Tax=Shinella pollutisoli TaxID=2250594 RepID=A0ABV7DLA9_9HYPH|nr:LysR substrate-binding domain-containing protein [Shinella pollutisoli]
MDIRQLRYFVAIAELGSFSRAAAQLHIAQPALSLHVRNMEAALGTPLLFRNPKGVVPTEAGEILLRNARAILSQIAIAEEEIRGHDSDPAGEVRIGLPGTIGQILAVPLILAARARYPRIKLRIAEAMSGFVLEWMRAARIDLAVLYREVGDGGIATVRLLEEELVFFGPPAASPGIALPLPGTTLPFRAVARMPLILPGGAHGLRELLEREAAACGATLDPVIDVDSYSNIKELVAAGLGYSILPLNAIAQAAGAGELSSWPIADPPLKRSIHLAHSTERPMTNAVRAIDALMRDVLQDLARTGAWAGTRVL